MSGPSDESPTSEEGPRQIYEPDRIEIVRFGGGAGGNAQTDLRMRMRIPDGRLICKFTLVASSAAINSAQAVLSGRNLSLWIYEEENDELRGKGFVPCVDLAGSTSTAPLAFPLNGGLGGFSREFVTTADAVGARLRVPVQGAGGIPGSVYLKARFQPGFSQVIPWAQWDEMRRQCKIDPLDTLLAVP